MTPKTDSPAAPPAAPPADEPKTDSPAAPPADGLVLLRAQPDVSGCSVDGVEYRVEDGELLVDEKHVERLLTVGFKR